MAYSDDPYVDEVVLTAELKTYVALAAFTSTDISPSPSPPPTEDVRGGRERMGGGGKIAAEFCFLFRFPTPSDVPSRPSDRLLFAGITYVAYAKRVFLLF